MRRTVLVPTLLVAALAAAPQLGARRLAVRRFIRRVHPEGRGRSSHRRRAPREPSASAMVPDLWDDVGDKDPLKLFSRSVDQRRGPVRPRRLRRSRRQHRLLHKSRDSFYTDFTDTDGTEIEQTTPPADRPAQRDGAGVPDRPDHAGAALRRRRHRLLSLAVPGSRRVHRLLGRHAPIFVDTSRRRARRSGRPCCSACARRSARTLFVGGEARWQGGSADLDPDAQLRRRQARSRRLDRRGQLPREVSRPGIFRQAASPIGSLPRPPASRERAGGRSSLSTSLRTSAAPIERDAAAFADAIERGEERRRSRRGDARARRRLRPVPRSAPTRRGAPVHEAVGPDLADAFVDVVAQLECRRDVSCMWWASDPMLARIGWPSCDRGQARGDRARARRCAADPIAPRAPSATCATKGGGGLHERPGRAPRQPRASAAGSAGAAAARRRGRSTPPGIITSTTM